MRFITSTIKDCILLFGVGITAYYIATTETRLYQHFMNKLVNEQRASEQETRSYFEKLAEMEMANN